MYGLAEILSIRLPSPEEYTGAAAGHRHRAVLLRRLPVPDHRAARTGWAPWPRSLPLTHALALFRYGLTAASGVRALHNIWGLSSATEMAALSMGVLLAYGAVAVAGALRLFAKSGTS